MQATSQSQYPVTMPLERWGCKKHRHLYLRCNISRLVLVVGGEQGGARLGMTGVGIASALWRGNGLEVNIQAK